MTDQMMAASLPDLVIDSDEVIDDNREVRGRIDAPNFIGSEGTIVVDADDKAIQQGTTDIPFLITIPETTLLHRRSGPRGIPVLAYRPPGSISR